MPDQPDQAIPQIAAFEQHEDDHRRDEPRRAQRPDDGPSHAKPEKPVTWSEVTTTGRDTVPLGPPTFQVGLDVFERLLQLLDRPSLARPAHVGDLRPDVGAIAGKVLGQMVHLPRQTPAGETEGREHQRDHRENGWDATDPPLKPGDGRRQDEREQDGERERHEDGLCPVQNGDDEHTPGERHPSSQCLRRIIHRGPRPFLGLRGAGRRDTKGCPRVNLRAAESKQASCRVSKKTYPHTAARQGRRHPVGAVYVP